jgi:hypothetical protein
MEAKEFYNNGIGEEIEQVHKNITIELMENYAKHYHESKVNTKFKNIKNMREIYFKIKQNSELPKAMLNYTYKDFDGVIQPFNNILVDFKEDDKNIEKMENAKKKYDSFFMFFNNSDEGIEFWKNNPITIAPKV